MKKRQSRTTILGHTVGSPTNDGLRALTDPSIQSYKTDLENQIAGEVYPNEKHQEALDKAKQKLEIELRRRESI